MTRLKDFIDFAYTLKEMEEVKDNKFPLPKKLTFELDKLHHSVIQRDLHEQKGLGEFKHSDIFDMVVFDIIFEFKIK